MATGLKGKSFVYTSDSSNSEAVTFDNTTNLVESAGTAYVNGDRILFELSGGTLPAELALLTNYYVVNADTNDFQVALTLGGDPVEFTDDGTITVNAVDAPEQITLSGCVKFSLESAGTLKVWTASQAAAGAVNGQASYKQDWLAATPFSQDANSSQNNSEFLEDIIIEVPDAGVVEGWIWGQGAAWTVE